jgi:hypothetical protein
MNRTLRSLDTVMLGDCIGLMNRLDVVSIDFVLTDPPYITNYRDRSGRTVANDDNDRWIDPAFAEIFRLLTTVIASASMAGTRPTASLPSGGGRAFNWPAISFSTKVTPPRCASCATTTSKPTFWSRAIPGVQQYRFLTFCHSRIAAIGSTPRRSPSRL